MIDVKAKRSFFDTRYGRVRAGDTIKATESAARELADRGLVSQPAEEKSAPEPHNKAAPVVTNKAEPVVATSVKSPVAANAKR